MLYNISNMENYGWICTAGVPLQNKKTGGDRYAFLLVDDVHPGSRRGGG